MVARKRLKCSLLWIFLLALSACGGSTRSRPGDASPVKAGEECTSSDQCPMDYTCAGGCDTGPSHCLAGCQTDADCSEGTCAAVQCIAACPCPTGTCG
jgi:hypothetical protein